MLPIESIKDAPESPKYDTTKQISEAIKNAGKDCLANDLGVMTPSMRQHIIGGIVINNINKVLEALEFYDKEFLNKLKQDVNQACKDALNANIDDAVNWGDLRCTATEVSIDDEGHKSYKVFISEVSPTAPVFVAFVHNILANLGYTNVEIITEW